MAPEEEQIVELRDDFYRDSFGKVAFIIVSFGVAISLLCLLSAYLYFKKPAPIFFRVGDGWRVQPLVPIDQPYLTTPEVLQWVTTTITQVFVYDFNHYNTQLQDYAAYFTDNGWKIFSNQLNIYANYTNVQTNKLFVNGTPNSAPFVLNQGLLTGRYAWWVQIPLNISYAGYSPLPARTLQLQVLVVRVPTLDDLDGIKIDNVIVANGAGNAAVGG